jgi:8-oxo-dGTP pyrophosphatase MutT (NUDIX family)
MSPRGKVMIGESPKIAIQREIAEELDLPIEATNNIKFIKTSVSHYNSDFFPGLQVIALDYDFELHLDDKYVRDEYIEHQEKKDSYFRWFDK